MQPSHRNIVSVLRHTRPDIYSEILSSFRPMQHDFSVIDKLYENLPGLENRDYFFGCVVMLFRRFDKSKLKDHLLHYGVSDYLCKVTGLPFSNVTVYVQQIHFLLHNLSGFKEETELILNKILKQKKHDT